MEGDLSLSIHEHSLCNLFITGDINIYQRYMIKRSLNISDVTTPNEEVSY